MIYQVIMIKTDILGNWLYKSVTENKQIAWI